MDRPRDAAGTPLRARDTVMPSVSRRPTGGGPVPDPPLAHAHDLMGKTGAMRDIVFTRRSGWIPQVIREDGELKLMLGAGADANHEPRTFTFPIGEAHLAVIREDLARHLLLWSAVLPLCDAAGTRGKLDENAAVALLDPILLSTCGGRRRCLRADPVGQGAAHRAWSRHRSAGARSGLRGDARGDGGVGRKARSGAPGEPPSRRARAGTRSTRHRDPEVHGPVPARRDDSEAHARRRRPSAAPRGHAGDRHRGAGVRRHADRPRPATGKARYGQTRLGADGGDRGSRRARCAPRARRRRGGHRQLLDVLGGRRPHQKHAHGG